MSFYNSSDKDFADINLSAVPNMSGTLSGWFQKMVFNQVIKTVVNALVKETTIDIQFMGVWQPLSPEKLDMKPDGQQSWPWFQVHSHTELPLKTDDVIKYKNVQYRVDAILAYKEYGYYEYHIVEDYSNSGPEVTP